MQNIFLTLASLGTKNYIMLAVAVFFIVLLFILNKNSLIRVLISLVTTYAVVITYMNIVGVPFALSLGYFLLVLSGILALAGQITGMLQKRPGFIAKIMASVGLGLAFVELLFI